MRRQALQISVPAAQPLAPQPAGKIKFGVDLYSLRSLGWSPFQLSRTNETGLAFYSGSGRACCLGGWLDSQTAVIEGWTYDRWGAGERPAAWNAVMFGERVFALLILAALLPFLIVAGGIVILLSRRSPLVAHARVGRNGKQIRVLKLRTMWSGAASKPGPFSYFVEHHGGEQKREVSWEEMMRSA